MTKAHDRFRILLVDPDDLLAADADALAHPEIEFLSSPIAAASALPADACDVMVMSIDAPAALDLLATICARGAPPPSRSRAGDGPAVRWNSS